MKRIFFTGILILALLFLPNHLLASTPLYEANLYGSFTTVSDDLRFLDIYADPAGTPMNAVGLYIDYPLTSEIIAIDMANSFCTMTVIKEFSNSEGKARVLCGLPNPGTDQKSLIARIAILSSPTDLEKISINSSSSMLANDGFGTDILTKINKLHSDIE